MLSLIYDRELLGILEDFYTLSGTKITLFDMDCNEVVSYPKNKKSPCTYLKNNKELGSVCKKCSEKLFADCRKINGVVQYKCPAGLARAMTSIVENHKIMGYMMIGEIVRDKAVLLQRMEQVTGKRCFNFEEIKDIECKSDREMIASARMIDVLAQYLQFCKIVRQEQESFADKIEKFIYEHIKEKITIDSLCCEFGMSRTRLYQTITPCIGDTLGNFIIKKRIDYAKELLKNSDFSMDRISEEVGFADYNYFLRVFKKQCGISPKKFADSIRREDA